MSTVIIDLIDGARWQETDGRLTRATRTAIVQVSEPDVGGGEEPLVGEDLFERALLADDMPQVGDPHPTVDGVVLRNRRATARGHRIVFVELEYGLPDEGGGGPPIPPGDSVGISGGTFLETVDEAQDVTGADIQVSYKGEVQGGTVQVQRPRDQVELTGYVYGQPGAITRGLVGRVNSDGFTGIDPAAAPGTWRCEGGDFEYEPLDEGSGFLTDRYRLTLRFSFNPNGWNPRVWYTDADTGEPVPDAVEGVGKKTVQAYQAVSFSAITALFA